MKTVWITKYALTHGVMEVKVDIASDKTFLHRATTYHPKDREMSLEKALIKAEGMRQRSLIQLKRQLAGVQSRITELEALKFS